MPPFQRGTYDSTVQAPWGVKGKVQRIFLSLWASHRQADRGDAWSAHLGRVDLGQGLDIPDDASHACRHYVSKPYNPDRRLYEGLSPRSRERVPIPVVSRCSNISVQLRPSDTTTLMCAKSAERRSDPAFSRHLEPPPFRRRSIHRTYCARAAPEWRFVCVSTSWTNSEQGLPWIRGSFVSAPQALLILAISPAGRCAIIDFIFPLLMVASNTNCTGATPIPW